MNSGLESLGRAGPPASILPVPEGSGPRTIPVQPLVRRGLGLGSLLQP